MHLSQACAPALQRLWRHGQRRAGSLVGGGEALAGRSAVMRWAAAAAVLIAV